MVIHVKITTVSAQYFQKIQTIQLFYKGIAFCHGLYLPDDVYLPPGDQEMNWDLNDFNISPENFFISRPDKKVEMHDLYLHSCASAFR